MHTLLIRLVGLSVKYLVVYTKPHFERESTCCNFVRRYLLISIHFFFLKFC